MLDFDQERNEGHIPILFFARECDMKQILYYLTTILLYRSIFFLQIILCIISSIDQIPNPSPLRLAYSRNLIYIYTVSLCCTSDGGNVLFVFLPVTTDS
jgi:hypothetical protein